MGTSLDLRVEKSEMAKLGCFLLLVLICVTLSWSEGYNGQTVEEQNHLMRRAVGGIKRKKLHVIKPSANKGRNIGNQPGGRKKLKTKASNGRGVKKPQTENQQKTPHTKTRTKKFGNPNVKENGVRKSPALNGN